MNKSDFYYKGYLIEFDDQNFTYDIKKGDKLIFSCQQQFPFIAEAEVHAKMTVNRLEERNDGWMVSS